MKKQVGFLNERKIKKDSILRWTIHFLWQEHKIHKVIYDIYTPRKSSTFVSSSDKAMWSQDFLSVLKEAFFRFQLGNVTSETGCCCTCFCRKVVKSCLLSFLILSFISLSYFPIEKISGVSSLATAGALWTYGWRVPCCEFI